MCIVLLFSKGQRSWTYSPKGCTTQDIHTSPKNKEYTPLVYSLRYRNIYKSVSNHRCLAPMFSYFSLFRHIIANKCFVFLGKTTVVKKK